MQRSTQVEGGSAGVVKDSLEILRKFDHYNHWVFAAFSPFVHGDILEIGAGIGTFTLLLLGRGNVTTIDNAPACVARAKGFLPNKATIGQGDIETGDYFFGDRKFDTIVCLNVLEHIKNDGTALSNMYSLLKSGGQLILLVPSHQSLYGYLDKNLGHYRRYSKKLLAEKLTTAGFVVRQIKFLNWFGALGWLMNCRVLRKRLFPEGQMGIFDLISRPALLIERYFQPPFGISVLAIGEKF